MIVDIYGSHSGALSLYYTSCSTLIRLDTRRLRVRFTPLTLFYHQAQRLESATMQLSHTFTANVAASMLRNYPDVSPYDYKPLPHHVVPPYNTVECRLENRAKLASYRLKTGINVINIHGDNPYAVPRAEAPSCSLPLSSRRKVGPLKYAPVGDALVFVEQTTTSAHGISFKIRIGEEFRLIKVVSTPHDMHLCLCVDRHHHFVVLFQCARRILTGILRVRNSHGKQDSRARLGAGVLWPPIPVGFLTVWYPICRQPFTRRNRLLTFEIAVGSAFI